MHNSSRLSTLFKKLSFSFFILLSLELTSIGTDKIYAAIEPTLTFEALYTEQCAVCHGSELQGEAIGVPLVGWIFSMAIHLKNWLLVLQMVFLSLACLLGRRPSARIK